MRRPEKALSARFVQTVSEPGKYFDGHGLILRVDAHGNKAWVQRIVIQGKRREIGLGSAVFVSLAEARATAYENRKQARSGGDPLLERRAQQEIQTFETAARTIYDMLRPTWKNEKHASQFISTLETYVFPTIGRTKVSDVTSADVLEVLRPIWTEKAETASRVRQRISKVMKWGIAQGWRKDNPAIGITNALPKQTAARQQRKAMDYTEVPAFLTALRQSQAGMSTRLCLEFLILTCARSLEARGARWDEIDTDARAWNVPADRMKMKRPHRVPLSSRALAIIEEAKAMQNNSGLIFPGTKAGKMLSDMTLSKLVKELGFPVDVHGFRTSFRTWTQEKTNFPNDIAERALAHTVGSDVERAYARSDLFEKRRKMMDAWAGYLAQDSAKVVRIG
ncbi:Prophage CP4-57 integrase [Paracoccus haematequi]|uniref:Prophage CP4-57 integrase n=1 Tax=Paracoccus haematequi TaxID=2491866 RepID=A0A3S4CL40_9RHOB|nr:integrase arm-type DNA-binding domain-containing protein [Paracoccus haematequi]VDS10022.1 Prophage CP4-57 integrase [Paracoccus haematequi]